MFEGAVDWFASIQANIEDLDAVAWNIVELPGEIAESLNGLPDAINQLTGSVSQLADNGSALLR